MDYEATFIEGVACMECGKPLKMAGLWQDKSKAQSKRLAKPSYKSSTTYLQEITNYRGS